MDRIILRAEKLGKYFLLNDDLISKLFSYPQYIKAVDGVSFFLKEGRAIGLVGESGSGKSTVAKIITRLIPATFGEVWHEGVNILNSKSLPPQRVWKNIQMIFQDPYESLNPRWKIGRTLGRPVKLFQGLRGEKCNKKVIELLEMVGLGDEHFERFPHEFSGGQRQRIAIARALAAQPRIVIADEPLSALDVSVQAQILNLFREFQKRFGLTYLFISHDLNVVEYLCDEIVVIYLGKMMEYGSSEEIFSFPSHPYTKALISSIPSMIPKSFDFSLKGEAKEAVNLPNSCRLVSRCPNKSHICEQEEPPLKELKKEHWVACHLC